MINAYMKDSITVKTATRDQWGTSSYESSTIKGRFEFKTKLVRNLEGEQVVSTATLYLPLMTLLHDDKIVYESKEYSILNIEQVKDFSNKFLRVSLA